MPACALASRLSRGRLATFSPHRAPTLCRRRRRPRDAGARSAGRVRALQPRARTHARARTRTARESFLFLRMSAGLCALVLRWRRLDPRTRQVVIYSPRAIPLFMRIVMQSYEFVRDCRFGCGSYRLDGDGSVCVCLHTTHNAVAAPCPACFRLFLRLRARDSLPDTGSCNIVYNKPTDIHTC
eukprot:COSAG02_NODE_1240_length_13709_cov_14.174798_5_plen_183_part_00